MEEEYDAANIRSILMVGHCWIGSDPGAKKLYAAISTTMLKEAGFGRKTLPVVVMPLNRLNEEYKFKGFEVQTPYQLPGLMPADSKRGKHYKIMRKPTDLSGFTFLLCNKGVFPCRSCCAC